MSAATMVAGGRGAVIDGLCRDVKKIKQLGFPVFVKGRVQPILMPAMR